MTARSTPYAMDMGNRDYRCYAKESVQYVRCVAVNGLTIMVITSGRDDGMKHVLHSHQIYESDDPDPPRLTKDSREKQPFLLDGLTIDTGGPDQTPTYAAKRVRDKFLSVHPVYTGDAECRHSDVVYID